MVQVRFGYLVFILLFFGSVSVNAQYFEGGLMGGGSLYEGDLSPHGFGNKLKLLRPAYGVFARQNFNPNVAVRLSFQYGSIQAADGEARRNRNLNFNSTFGELAAIVEYTYPGLDPNWISEVLSLCLRWCCLHVL